MMSLNIRKQCTLRFECSLLPKMAPIQNMSFGEKTNFWRFEGGVGIPVFHPLYETLIWELFGVPTLPLLLANALIPDVGVSVGTSGSWSPMFSNPPLGTCGSSD